MKITIKIPAAINDLYSQLDEIVEIVEKLERKYPHIVGLKDVEIVLADTRTYDTTSSPKEIIREAFEDCFSVDKVNLFEVVQKAIHDTKKESQV